MEVPSRVGVNLVVSHGIIRVAVVCRDGWVDWPIMYDDFTVGWDNPGRVPKYLKEEAARLLRTVRKYRSHLDTEMQGRTK